MAVNGGAGAGAKPHFPRNLSLGVGQWELTDYKQILQSMININYKIDKIHSNVMSVMKKIKWNDFLQKISYSFTSSGSIFSP